MRYFVGCLSIEVVVLNFFFSLFDLGYGFWKEDHKGKVTLLAHKRYTTLGSFEAVGLEG